MGEVSTIGLDIAKSVFQVHEVDVAGTVVMRKRISRAKVLEFFAALPPCLVGRCRAIIEPYLHDALMVIGEELLDAALAEIKQLRDEIKRLRAVTDGKLIEMPTAAHAVQ